MGKHTCFSTGKKQKGTGEVGKGGNLKHPAQEKRTDSYSCIFDVNY